MAINILEQKLKDEGDPADSMDMMDLDEVGDLMDCQMLYEEICKKTKAGT